MADHGSQRIHKVHPLDLEDQAHHPPPPQSDHHQHKHHHPNTATPPPPPPPRRRRSCCCRCVCWTFCIVIALIVSLAITVGVLYLVFQPKLPSYSVDELRIAAFNATQLDPLTVSSTYIINITATNPNDKIGIYYEQGTELILLYSGVELSKGQLPVFYQGHRNVTVVSVTLTGDSVVVGTVLRDQLIQQQQAGAVPLDFKGSIPVRVEFGALKLMKVTFLVRCSLVVDRLSANDGLVNVKSHSCGFQLKI